jgi:pimeloyl-ACP methyl ester carboxylesterase
VESQKILNLRVLRRDCRSLGQIMAQRFVVWFRPMRCASLLGRGRRGAVQFLFVVCWAFLTGCVATKPTRVVLVGGAGLSQLGELGSNISAMCPDADVVETGGWDGFRGDVKRAATEPPCQSVILIGHSFGCQTIADAAADLDRVDLVVMIDPAWDDMTVPRSVKSCIWYQRSDEAGMERRSVVRNAGRPVVIAGDHNDICHNARLMAEVSRIVRDMSDRSAMQERMRKGVR